MTTDTANNSKQQDLTQLKLILTSLKKKYEKAIGDLLSKEKRLREEVGTKELLEEENQALVAQMSMLKACLEQRQQEAHSSLEKNQQDWRDKLIVAEAEIKNLEETKQLLNAELQRAYNQPKQIEENSKQKHEIQLLLAKLEETDTLRATYERQSLDLIHQVHDLEAFKEEVERTKLTLVDKEHSTYQLKNELVEFQEQAERDKQRIEKLAAQLFEKDKRIQDLQRLEGSLKKAGEQKQELEQALEEKKLLEEQFLESRQHAEQLERVINFLRERSEGANLELVQLREEFQKSQDLLHVLKKQQDLLHSEKDALQQQAQREQREKQDALDEIRLLQEQFLELKNRYSLLQKELDETHVALGTANTLKEQLEAQQRECSRLIDDQRKHLENFERESSLIKQTLIRGLKEAQEIQKLYQDAVEDRVSTSAKLHQSHQQLDRYRDQQKQLQEQIEESRGNVRTLSARLEEALRDNEDQEKLCQQIQELKCENEKLHTDALRLQQVGQEKDAEITQVQHHFAKKMKEASTFEDKCEEQARLISEQQQTLYQNKVKIAELQTSVDIQTQQQKLFQDQLQEAIRNSEVQMQKWEEKYFAIYDKWQASENRAKELERLEEKQKHLQGMLTNLGSYFGQPVAVQPVPPPVHTEPVPPKMMQEVVKLDSTSEENLSQESPKAVYQNLFNMPKAPTRPRQNFLE